MHMASMEMDNLSIVRGPSQPNLWDVTVSDLIYQQAAKYGNRTAVVVAWQSSRTTYNELAVRSGRVSLALLGLGLKHGDRIGIMAGNRLEYLETFLGAARIGCPVVVLNNTYKPVELLNAVQTSGCKAVFMATSVGPVMLTRHIESLRGNDSTDLPKPHSVSHIVGFDKIDDLKDQGTPVQTYSDFLEAVGSPDDQERLQAAESLLKAEDVINLQFTSGTTGAPKAAALTSRNIINNGRFCGDALLFQPADVVCCPPPLFHCFGLVIGFLASYTHGSAFLMPSDSFNAAETIQAVHDEKATALLGVPTMFLAAMDVVDETGQKPSSLRICLASGAPVTMSLVNKMSHKMGVKDIMICYGMTETSPVSFITSVHDPMEKKLSTVGRAMPHVTAKVIDTQGHTVPRGQRGELCVAGFGLQKGYWENPEKTAEVMRRGSDGIIWMHSGDEACIDDEGYARITGRIKDVIIRGGENIFPGEIEARLVEHPDIAEAVVVAIRDDRYGEVVGSFLRLASMVQTRPSDQEVRDWVLQTLARQKAPKHVFWVGDAGHIPDFPKTGSGKHQKHILRDLGNRLTIPALGLPDGDDVYFKRSTNV